MPVAATGRERPVYTLRIGKDERRLLEAAAAEGGQSLAQYIRGSALCAARRKFAEITAVTESIPHG